MSNYKMSIEFYHDGGDLNDAIRNILEEVAKKCQAGIYEEDNMSIEFSTNKLVKVDWDTSDDCSDYEGENVELPNLVEVPVSVPEDEIADWLSDQFGYCVNGFSH